MSKTPLRHTITTKRYEFELFGRACFVPAGWHVTNQTAMGPDDRYHYPADITALAKLNRPEYPDALRHDLEYHAPNIPAEFCAPWPETPAERQAREWEERKASYPMLDFVYAEKGGRVCPLCGATDVETGESETQGATMTRVDACRACNKAWVATFELKSYTVLP